MEGGEARARIGDRVQIARRVSPSLKAGRTPPEICADSNQLDSLVQSEVICNYAHLQAAKDHFFLILRRRHVSTSTFLRLPLCGKWPFSIRLVSNTNVEDADIRWLHTPSLVMIFCERVVVAIVGQRSARRE